MFLCRHWGKVPVHARSTPGFIVNRIARPYYAEALALLQERATTPAVLDACFRAAGFRMGPCELIDLIGHDTNFASNRCTRPISATSGMRRRSSSARWSTAACWVESRAAAFTTIEKMRRGPSPYPLPGHRPHRVHTRLLYAAVVSWQVALQMQ